MCASLQPWNTPKELGQCRHHAVRRGYASERQVSDHPTDNVDRVIIVAALESLVYQGATRATLTAYMPLYSNGVRRQNVASPEQSGAQNP